MNDEMQAMCFFAGANSIFYGEKLLTAGNPEANSDKRLFERLGIYPMQHDTKHSEEEVAASLLAAVSLGESQQQVGSKDESLFYDATRSTSGLHS
jgi:biotin synthase